MASLPLVQRWRHSRSASGSSASKAQYAQTIETNGAIRYRTWQAREQWHQAQHDEKTAELSLKLGIIDAFVGAQLANRILEVELAVYDNVHKLTELTQHRYETGAGPQADLTRAQIAEIQEKQNLITDVAGVNLARATLNSQLGRSPTQQIDVAEPLVYHAFSFPPESDLISVGERNRPELMSAQSNLHSLQAIPGHQRSAYFPDLILARDFGSDSMLFMGLSVPLDLGSIRGSVAKAKADVKTQQAQVESQRLAIDLDVKSSYENFLEAQKQVDSYNSGVLQMSQNLLDQVRHGYELGANTIVDVITAENTYRSVESSYYSAVGNYVETAYALQHSIGKLPDQGPLAALKEVGSASRSEQ